MRHLFRGTVWVVGAVLVQLAAGEPLNPKEWRYFAPILKPQARMLEPGEADRILARLCQTPVRAIKGMDLTCTTRRLGSAFSSIVDRTFHPKGVMFGHFLAPESDDAAVSGSSAEGHAGRYGGTLLLSRREGTWMPIWYRSAMIIDSCEKVTLPDRREVLLCEDEDSGMGHALHYLYTVDFEHPSDLQNSLLAKADSFEDFCAAQEQLLKGFRWRADRQEFSVEIDTTAFNRVSTEQGCAKYPRRRPAPVRLTFSVTPEGLRKLEAEPAAKK